MTIHDLKSLSDEKLVKFLKKGDADAFAELMDRYKGQIFGTAYRYLGNREDAADVAQEVFVKVYRTVGRFAGRSKLSTWLYRIVVNTSLNWQRTSRRRGEHMARSIEEMTEKSMAGHIDVRAGGVAMPARNLERRELADLLQTKLESLPEKYRLVFILREMRQMSYDEIADATGLPVGTVKSRLSEARRRLREMLRPYLASA
jgi:RNA polymerase sigma-70 factor (ECF subfamily)